MSRLLIVHHSPSETPTRLLDAVVAGATNDHIEGVDVVTSEALTTSAQAVLDADGYVLGTPANLGYMSGALKHFFDTVYNPCLEVTAGRPFGAYIHGQTDTTGAALSIEKVTTGLGWSPVADVVSSLGEPDQATLDACWELGAVAAATLML